MCTHIYVRFPSVAECRCTWGQRGCRGRGVEVEPEGARLHQCAHGLDRGCLPGELGTHGLHLEGVNDGMMKW